MYLHMLGMGQKMHLNDILFLDRFPALDLHGYDRQTARVAIDDFVRDHVKMKNEICLIIHGIGSGILKQVTQETLKKNKHVVQYQIHYFNQGCTIVQLKVDNYKDT